MAESLLSLSILLQAIAALLALRIAWSTQRIAWLLVAFAIGLMTGRRGFTLYGALAFHKHIDPGAETIALVISLLMLAGVWRLRRRQGLTEGMGPATATPARMTRIAIALGLLTMLTGATLSYFAYQANRRLLIEGTLAANLSTSRSIANYVQAHANQPRATLRERVASRWHSIPQRYRDANVSLVDANGHTVLASAARTTHFTGDATTVSGSEPTDFGSILARRDEWSGLLQPTSGDQQAIALVPVQDTAWTVGLHVPLATVEREIIASSIPWLSGIVLIAVLLLPLSLGLLHWAYSLAQRRASALEDQLREAHKMEAVGQLAGGIAHDFNNLTMVIAGHSEILAQSLPSNHELQPQIGVLRDAADQASALTERLLAFGSRQSIQPTTLDLNVAVRRTCAMLERLIGDHIRVVTRLDADPCRVHTDPAQIDQAILNLAINARDAMPDGGTLLFETSIRAERVRLRITDDGTGIDAPTLARIFEPFFTTKHRSGGTGLGLSMVYRFVHQSGGSIQATSKPGNGSTFTITLPRTTCPIASPRPLPEPLPEALPEAPREEPVSLRVLLVEDDPAVRALTRQMLALEGHRVLEAADGEAAVATLQSQPEDPVDLVLTDVLMPNMQGTELWAELQNLGCTAKFIFMSGYAGERNTEALASAKAFLGKPFTRADLRRAIHTALTAEPQ